MTFQGIILFLCPAVAFILLQTSRKHHRTYKGQIVLLTIALLMAILVAVDYASCLMAFAATSPIFQIEYSYTPYDYVVGAAFADLVICPVWIAIAAVRMTKHKKARALRIQENERFLQKQAKLLETGGEAEGLTGGEAERLQDTNHQSQIINHQSPEPRPWKVLKSERIMDRGPWLSVRQELVELPNGRQIPTWYILDFMNWVNVIAITKDGRFVLIDQYRHGIGQTHYELCAGCIDDGESPLMAAQRELLEETGFGGGFWSEFMVAAPNPSNQSNWCYTFLAVGVEQVNEPHLEATEDIRVHILTKEQVWQLLQAGEIVSCHYSAALWKYFANNR